MQGHLVCHGLIMALMKFGAQRVGVTALSRPDRGTTVAHSLVCGSRVTVQYGAIEIGFWRVGSSFPKSGLKSGRVGSSFLKFRNRGGKITRAALSFILRQECLRAKRSLSPLVLAHTSRESCKPFYGQFTARVATAFPLVLPLACCPALDPPWLPPLCLLAACLTPHQARAAAARCSKSSRKRHRERVPCSLGWCAVRSRVLCSYVST